MSATFISLFEDDNVPLYDPGEKGPEDNGYCGPALASAVFGVPRNEGAALIQRVRKALRRLGQQVPEEDEVSGVYINELVTLLIQNGVQVRPFLQFEDQESGTYTLDSWIISTRRPRLDSPEVLTFMIITGTIGRGHAHVVLVQGDNYVCGNCTGAVPYTQAPQQHLYAPVYAIYQLRVDPSWKSPYRKVNPKRADR